MARGYKTDMGVVVVKNMLGNDSDDVLYMGYLIDEDGNAIEHSHKQIERHPKGNERQMRRLREYVVECVLSCYRVYLHQHGQCKKKRRVMFSSIITVETYVKDPKVSRVEKIRGWIEFGIQMRQQGLCSPDTAEDLLEDAIMCKMPR